MRFLKTQTFFSNHALIGSIVCFFFSWVSPTYSTPQYESNDHLKTLIESFVKKYTAHNPDETISVVINAANDTKLNYCQQDITIAFANNDNIENQNVVQLECNGSENWHIYIPIRIQIMAPVLVANRMLSAGDLITEDVLEYRNYDRNRLHDGYYTQKNELVNFSALKTINVGTPLTKKNLKQVPLVRRNQTVTLALRQGGIEIDMLGIAKSDGFMNSRIQILNPMSKKTVDAVVSGKDRVVITY